MRSQPPGLAEPVNSQRLEQHIWGSPKASHIKAMAVSHIFRVFAVESPQTLVFVG